nr:hypothetical protein [Marimonas arenosa]
MMPQDIADFGLADATHPLSKTDIKRARDALKNDPFVVSYPEWIGAIDQLLDTCATAPAPATSAAR